VCDAIELRATFVMCGLDAHQPTITWSHCMQAFDVTGRDPATRGCSPSPRRPPVRRP
jgi:hypothetical protein